MLQALLADRFKLKIVRETRDVPGYSLALAKDGPKLTVSTDSKPQIIRFPVTGFLEAHNTTMSELARVLSGRLNAPVTNNTALVDRFDFTLKVDWSKEEWQSFSPTDPTAPPSILRTIAQLGLVLIPQKVPSEIIVIRHVKHPSPN